MGWTSAGPGHMYPVPSSDRGKKLIRRVSLRVSKDEWKRNLGTCQWQLGKRVSKVANFFHFSFLFDLSVPRILPLFQFALGLRTLHPQSYVMS